MQKIYVMKNSHTQMRGFEYFVYASFSLSLLIILAVLPLAPLFASEDLDNSLLETPNSLEEPTEPSSEEPTEPSPEEYIEVDQPSGIPDELEEGQGLVSTSGIGTESGVVTENEVGETLLQEDGESEVLSIGPIHDNAPLDADEEVSTSSSSESTALEAVTEEVIDEELEAEIPHSIDSFDSIHDTDSLSENTDSEEVTPPLFTDISSENSDTEMETTVTETYASTSEQIDEIVVTSVPGNTVTNDDNRFTFAKSECTVAGDEVFYCTKSEQHEVVNSTDRVFSAVDNEGDKEIYVEENTEITQITDNQYEDDAPYYDELSNTLVWHRLIEGRYQIISYDVETSEEEQLTFDRYNNMEPQRSGDALVWQGWVGNDWEIFMLEGDELTMLSDNTVQDIMPSINGEYIVWQSFESDAWKMKVYDIRTKSIKTIEDSNGGSIENPRFVLVYDSKQQTGDVETRGYDLQSGEVIPLTSKPVSIPEKIPDPEQTGEERALVTSPVQPKTKIDERSDDESTGDGNPPTATHATTSTIILDTDLVIPPITDRDTFVPHASTTSTVVESPSLIADFVIPAIGSSTDTATEHIDDLVVEPYTEIGLPVSHSQEDVASST